jgi:glutamyl-tRNA synthetase/glutamyl-Q tRNA(Asp) synthetase
MRSLRGRFAPSTTGRAHPGTLLAALLCWLDARSQGGEVWLRLEDLDPQRSNPGLTASMEADLEWFGLDWDGLEKQSQSLARYEERIDQLAESGRVYVCRCSRTTIRKSGHKAPDGSYRYPGSCRERLVGRDAWREQAEPLRLRIEAGSIALQDEGGLDLSGDPAALFGDPLLRRRDGAYAYHLTSVVDDEAIGVNRIVRGRDLAPVSILQAALRRDFGGQIPAYRHHLLLLEAGDASRPEKLSKFHGAVDLPRLRERLDAADLCGLLASWVGLVPEGERCRPRDLVADFDWARVAQEDVALEWSEREGLRRFPRRGSEESR